MSDTGRLHRNEPARTGPVRNLSNMYQRPGTPVEPQPGRESAAPAPAASNGRYSEGVATAYSVLEKHINQGRQAAQHFSRPAYDTKPAIEGIQKLLEDSLRYQLEMIPLLVETFANLMPIDPAAGPRSPSIWPQRPGYTNSAPAASTNGNPASVVSVEVASRQLVEVTLNMGDHSNVADLVSLGLHSIEPEKPALTDVSFARSDSGGAKLRVHVPDNQPAGVYSGVIVSRESGEPRGTLTVRIAQ